MAARPRSWWIPGITFAVVTLLALFIGPSRSALSLRAAAAASADCTAQIDIPELATWLPKGYFDNDEMKPGNNISVLVSWTGTGDPKKLTVKINPSKLKGNCSNAGKKTHEDFSIEGIYNDPLWNLTGKDLAYDKKQTLSATTKNAYPSGQQVEILLTSYDWGGNCKITLEVEAGCTKEAEIPLDTDHDGLPDAFEEVAKYWSNARTAPLTYNKGAASSAGTHASPDRSDESDLDERAAPVQAVFGDGFTAFEEYRAFRTGAIGRTRTLDNFMHAGKGGTQWKELFFVDEGGKALLVPRTFFVIPNNKYMDGFALIWHEIEDEDWDHDKGNLAGFVNFNGRRNQRGLWLVNHNGMMNNGAVVAGDANGFSVNEGTKIEINLSGITTMAGQLGLTTGELIDYTVAHEVGHKLGLRHNRGTRAPGPQPAVPNTTTYWIQGNTLNFYVPVRGNTSLERFQDFNPPGALKVNVQGVVAVGGTLMIGGVAHDAGIYRIVVGKAPRAGQEPGIELEAHLDNLMDPILNLPDIPLVKANPLTPAQQPIPDVTR